MIAYLYCAGYLFICIENIGDKASGEGARFIAVIIDCDAALPHPLSLAWLAYYFPLSPGHAWLIQLVYWKVLDNTIFLQSFLIINF